MNASASGATAVGVCRRCGFPIQLVGTTDTTPPNNKLYGGAAYGAAAGDGAGRGGVWVRGKLPWRPTRKERLRGMLAADECVDTRSGYDNSNSRAVSGHGSKAAHSGRTPLRSYYVHEPVTAGSPRLYAV